HGISSLPCPSRACDAARVEDRCVKYPLHGSSLNSRLVTDRKEDSCEFFFSSLVGKSFRGSRESHPEGSGNPFLRLIIPHRDNASFCSVFRNFSVTGHNEC